MIDHKNEELESAILQLSTTIIKCERMQHKFAERTSQYSLLRNRIKALTIAKALLSGDKTSTYTVNELQHALPPVVSIINKTTKAQSKHEEGSSGFSRFVAILETMRISLEIIEREISSMSRDLLIEEMKTIFSDIPYGIEHTLNVLHNADMIMLEENVDHHEAVIISAVAILHDIGAVEALSKYGSLEGVYQEMEGPSIARKILCKVGFESGMIERICYIIGNHHSPEKIDGLDFQIQWEADMLENMTTMDIEHEQEKIKKFIEDNYKTKAGKSIAIQRYIR